MYSMRIGPLEGNYTRIIVTQVQVPLKDDEALEGDETFLGQIILMPAIHPSVQLGVDEATVLIQDNDQCKL